MSTLLITMLASAHGLDMNGIFIDCVPQRHWFNADGKMKQADGEVDTNAAFLNTACNGFCDLTKYEKVAKCPSGSLDCWIDFGPDLCYMKPDATFKVDTVSTSSHTEIGLNPTYSDPMFSTQWAAPTLTLKEHTSSHVEILFTDNGKDRWMIPEELYPRDEQPSTSRLSFQFQFSDVKKGDLAFDVLGTSDTAIMSLIPQSVILEDTYLQVGFKLKSQFIAGVGEHMRQEIYRPRTVGTRRYLPCFARPVGVGPGNDYRSENLYGCHPVFTVQINDSDTDYLVVFAENSNAQEFELWAEDEELSQETVITWRAIGGVPRFHIFSGETELEAIAKYQAYIGKPFLPPYYAFGHQLSRYGYIGLDDIIAMHDRLDNNGVPFDIQTFDIDYMRRRMDFSMDDRPESDRYFGELPAYMKQLADRDVRSIMMFDPAISGAEAMLANDSDPKYGVGTQNELKDIPNYAGKKDGVFVGGLADDVFIRAPKDFNDGEFDSLHIGYRPPYEAYDTDKDPDLGWFDESMVLTYDKDDASTDLKSYESTMRRTLFGKVWPYMPYVQPASTCDAWVGLGGPTGAWTGGQVVDGASPTDTAWKLEWDWGVGACSAPAAFPDWMKKNTVAWWKKWIAKWRETFPVGAYWIDMNEPENFASGSIGNQLINGVPAYGGQCGDNEMNHPKFKPQMTSHEQPLYDKTLCMDAVHTLEASEYGGSEDIEVDHYNFHSMYGMSQGKATKKVIDEVHDERTFVFGRSTFAGAGSYMGHWTGDNTSAYDHMRASIPAMLDFNMFGVPFVGADICGFFNDTKKHLCFFWTQLGAFYPFSRNHNTIFTKEQDAASFGEEYSLAVTPALKMRYRLNPYLYNLFKIAHETGVPPVRSLYQNYPQERHSLRAYTEDMGYIVDREFMYGDKILFAPMVENLNEIDVDESSAEAIGSFDYDIVLPYFGNTWYNIWDGAHVEGGKHTITTEYLNPYPAIYIKSDTVLISKVPGSNNEDTRANSPFNIFITLGDKMMNENYIALETLYWDTGADKEDKWSEISVSAVLDCNKLEITVGVDDVHKYLEVDMQVLEGFTVYSPEGLEEFLFDEELPLVDGLSKTFTYIVAGVDATDCPDSDSSVLASMTAVGMSVAAYMFL